MSFAIGTRTRITRIDCDRHGSQVGVDGTEAAIARTGPATPPEIGTSPTTPHDRQEPRRR